MESSGAAASFCWFRKNGRGSGWRCCLCRWAMQGFDPLPPQYVSVDHVTTVDLLACAILLVPETDQEGQYKRQDMLEGKGRAGCNKVVRASIEVVWFGPGGARLAQAASYPIQPRFLGLIHHHGSTWIQLFNWYRSKYTCCTGRNVP